MKLVFIAGPLTTGWDGKGTEIIENNIRKAEVFQVALCNLGIGVFCPHSHTSLHHTKGSVASETFYYDLDLEFLSRCDALLALPDWQQSRGARKEVEWAIANQKPVFYPSSVDDLNEIVVWNKKEI
jgi:nucleoside 2-deoxyribosyltransferase